MTLLWCSCRTTACVALCTPAAAAAPPHTQTIVMGDHKKKATVLDMSKYMDQSVRVKFTGGREVIGVLKGCARAAHSGLVHWSSSRQPSACPPCLCHHPDRPHARCPIALARYDALLNLVLDETKEYLKDPEDTYRLLDDTRDLGLTVCRGTSVMLVCPTEGFEEIANPFLAEEGIGEEGEA